MIVLHTEQRAKKSMSHLFVALSPRQIPLFTDHGIKKSLNLLFRAAGSTAKR